ncbi:MAG: Crp/Fnr family transcriptional regulator [Pyrinomonadaceae bacterium]
MSEITKPNNRLLAALAPQTYQAVLPKLERIELNAGDTLYGPGDDFTHVYFVESGIVAMLVVIDNDLTFQCCMVGGEGMLGVPVFLGVKTSGNRAVVQCPGTAIRMKNTDFFEECSTNSEWSAIMREFTYSTIMHIALSAACNRFHNLEARLALWLLMTQDRLGSSEFKITQEFMSYMLGVRREAVSKIAASFQQHQLISYSRGDFTILDRKGLAKMVCSCYLKP